MRNARLPYGARNEEEMERNQARLGARWQERERSWDERIGDYGPALPLLPLVVTASLLVTVIGIVVLIHTFL
jgi:hypothetical protein